MKANELEYVGFWKRLYAACIDTLLLGLIVWPLLTFYYGSSYWTDDSLVRGEMDLILSWLFPAVACILFWLKKQATPGKMAIQAKIVDAQTGAAPGLGQCVLRYITYLLSMLPLGLGLIWVGFDRLKQGWHDKIAGTVVVQPKNRKPLPVSFENQDETP